MANSLEVRSPFLNHSLVDQAFSIPNKFKLKMKSTKFILKDLLSEYMSYSFAFRPKMGFAIPIEKWIENENFQKNRKYFF